MSDDLARRLANATPEQRRLLERMLAKKGIALPESESGGAPEKQVSTLVEALRRGAAPEGAPDGTPTPEVYGDKDLVRRSYGSYHDVLCQAVFQDQAVFMNLGYLPDGSPEHAQVELPERMIGRPFAKLALEVVGDCDLHGKRVLDVGCGRGGTLALVREWFTPAETVGLDLTPGAIEFCRRRFAAESTARFEIGDAEDMPFADACFDAVINIESSHHYPNIASFYREVHRVLVAGGFFLYTTVLDTPRFEAELTELRQLGFAVLRDQDITPNVLAACDANQDPLFSGVGEKPAEGGMAVAVGLPGSSLYEDMKSGRMSYRMFKLQKEPAE